MGAEKICTKTRSLFTGIDRPFLVTQSPAMIELIDLVKEVAARLSVALIEGETGTGKELMARALHANSSRHEKPFIAINCSAISELLLESELFGYVKGAFSGAHADKLGLAEGAEGGTLFLDEACAMSQGMQSKILRLLQEKEVLPVGSTRTRKVDIAVIAASNRDLLDLVKRGEFRSDLYYRLKVAFLRVPPLRDRLEDLRPLLEAFLAEYGRKHELPVPEVAGEFFSVLIHHPWAGNVRELENSIGTIYTCVREGRLDRLRAYLTPAPLCSKNEGGQQTPPPLDPERKRTEEALLLCGGNRTAAARLLGIDRRTIQRRIKGWGLGLI